MAALKVYYSSHRRAAVEHLIVVLAAAATVLILALTTADLASETLLMTILLAIAWLVVAAERYLSLYLAGLVTTARRPARSGAVELSARLRADHARIQSVERNLIVYNSTANFHDTFVGCGEPIDPHDINIDASIGRHDKDGKRLIPQKVDVGELHSVLLTAVLDLGAPGCWGGYRTYIDGRSIGDAPWTGDGPFDPLDVNIDDQLVRPGPRTERSPGRTYLCIQITTWDGDLVVTLFVRATLVGANLHLRQKVYVLAPLSLEFQETVRTLPRYTLRRLAVAAGYATRNTIPHLLSSPWRCAEVPARILGRDVRQVWDWWQISHGEDYDHGAAYSAREVFANTAMIHADAWDDVVQQVHLLQTGYTSALHHYLEGRDIDTSSLNETLKSFHLHQATSFTIDKVHNLSTGAHSKAGDETYFNPSPPDRPTPTTGSSGPSGSSGSES